MSEQTQAPQDIAAIQAFNESVNHAVMRNYDMNTALMTEGVSSTAVALANAMSAADLTAAMAVEVGNGMDAIEALLVKLADDMKSRAVAAFEFYSQQKAERDASEAAAPVAANDAVVTGEGV